jgi:hypothetical protein
MNHPREGWSYPFIERLVLMDCGFQIAASVVGEDGTRVIYRWTLADIIDLAERVEVKEIAAAGL